MDSKVKSMGHPVHPMLVNFPLGLLVTSISSLNTMRAKASSNWLKSDQSYSADHK